jgi:hypothetical protein
MQATIAKRVKIYLTAGWAQYKNEVDSRGGMIFSTGLSVFFDTIPTDKH